MNIALTSEKFEYIRFLEKGNHYCLPALSQTREE